MRKWMLIVSGGQFKFERKNVASIGQIAEVNIGSQEFGASDDGAPTYQSTAESPTVAQSDQLAEIITRNRTSALEWDLKRRDLYFQTCKEQGLDPGLHPEIDVSNGGFAVLVDAEFQRQERLQYDLPQGASDLEVQLARDRIAFGMPGANRDEIEAARAAFIEERNRQRREAARIITEEGSLTVRLLGKLGIK